MPYYYNYNYNINSHYKSTTYATKYSKYPQSPRQPDDTKLYAKNTENSRKQQKRFKKRGFSSPYKIVPKKDEKYKIVSNKTCKRRKLVYDEGEWRMNMAAERVKKKQISKPITKAPRKLRPRTPRANKIIELKQANPAMTVRDIATITNCDHSNVVRVLQRYGIVSQEVQDYKNGRADILAGMQDRILKSITDGDIQKAPVGSRVLAVAQLYDKERLERGQSTANIANNHSISESLQESIDKIIGRGKVEQDASVDQKISELVDITPDDKSLHKLSD